MRVVPGTNAVVKKTLPNGDLLVKVLGSKEDLQKAFAFYVGKKSYDELSPEDKKDFVARLVFDDGDTIAEADYREAVAHCLDPIGVKASTANLVDQDTCALSVIKEEKLRRKAAKMLKALREDDFSALSDENLEQLDKIKDAVDNREGLSGEDLRIWKTILSQVGFTPEEWEKLTPEQQKKAWKEFEDDTISPSGFARYQTKVDPKTGKTIRYQNKYAFLNPETGDVDVTQFNPDYTMDKSMYQHPSAAKRQMKKDAASAEKAEKEALAKKAMMKARGKRTETGEKGT